MLLTLEANVSAIVGGVCPLDSTTTDRAMTSKVVHIFSVSTYYSAALPGAPPLFYNNAVVARGLAHAQYVFAIFDRFSVCHAFHSCAVDYGSLLK